MTRQLAHRITSAAPSATLAVSRRAAELRAAGVDVIAFGVGEPDFHTPPHIVEAASAAAANGATHYTAAGGIAELRAAIAADSTRRRGIAVEPPSVVVSVGAKHTLFNLAMVLLEPGDEVLIPAPYWVSYPAQPKLVGAVPKIVPTTADQGFRLQPDQLSEHLTPATKAIILCSPSNPTGAAYSKEELRALADRLAGHPAWIIVDEIYGELVYDGFVQHSLATVAPELADRLIIVDGVSKTYAMTGWRIGWMIGPPTVAKAVEKLQGQSTSNPAAVSQHAALAALTGPKAPIGEMHAAFSERRKTMLAALGAIEGVRCRTPEGAFYAFPDLSAFLGRSSPDGVRIDDDVQLATYLLERARCALVPGSAFGAPGFARLSYATSNELISEGVRRIGEALGALR